MLRETAKLKFLEKKRILRKAVKKLIPISIRHIHSKIEEMVEYFSKYSTPKGLIGPPPTKIVDKNLEFLKEIAKLNFIQNYKKNIKEHELFLILQKYMDKSIKSYTIISVFKNFMYILNFWRGTKLFYFIYILCILKMYFILEYSIKSIINNLKNLAPNTYTIYIKKTKVNPLEIVKLHNDFKKVFIKIIAIMFVIFAFHSILYYLIPLIIVCGFVCIDSYYDFYLTIRSGF